MNLGYPEALIGLRIAGARFTCETNPISYALYEASIVSNNGASHSPQTFAWNGFLSGIRKRTKPSTAIARGCQSFGDPRSGAYSNVSGTCHEVLPQHAIWGTPRPAEVAPIYVQPDIPLLHRQECFDRAS
jgi:hypothetical protein